MSRLVVGLVLSGCVGPAPEAADPAAGSGVPARMAPAAAELDVGLTSRRRAPVSGSVASPVGCRVVAEWYQGFLWTTYAYTDHEDGWWVVIDDYVPAARAVETYDLEGRLLSIWRTYDSSYNGYIVANVYDVQGSLTSKQGYRQEGARAQTQYLTSYTNDDHGNRLTEWFLPSDYRESRKEYLYTWEDDLLVRLEVQGLFLDTLEEGPGEIDTWEYDELGQMTAHHDWMGRNTLHTYWGYDDPGNQVWSLVYDDGDGDCSLSTYEYDERGNLVREQNHDSGCSRRVEYEDRYTYDEFDRLIVFETERFGPPAPRVSVHVEFTYDEWGNLLSEAETSSAGTYTTTWEYECD